MSALFPPVSIGGAPLIAQAPGGGGAPGWNTEFATADVQQLSNITPTLDTELFINVIAGKTYAFDVVAFFSANGAQDVTTTMGGTATATRFIAGRQITDNSNTFLTQSPTLLTPSPHTAFPANVSTNTSLSEWSGPVRYFGSFTAATSGTFGIKWSQSVSSGVNPTTRLAGSYLNWKQVD